MLLTYLFKIIHIFSFSYLFIYECRKLLLSYFLYSFPLFSFFLNIVVYLLHCINCAFICSNKLLLQEIKLFYEKAHFINFDIFISILVELLGLKRVLKFLCKETKGLKIWKKVEVLDYLL